MRASLELDAQALALLDRLLDAGAAERRVELEQLHAIDAALHDRLLRLLDAAEDPECSRGLAAPLVAGLHQAAGARGRPGDLVAGWRLLRELGRGGMSVVWLAERAEGGLRREVAIKLPLEAELSGVLAERFARERDVLAGLDHPHIARLFDAGVMPTGQPYIVLEFVPGQPITAAAAPLSTRGRLALFRQVLAAVEHAHRHLVVHRDLKPSNILVTADGRVKLLDFGIAKLLSTSGAADLTRDAAIVMTPRYAAPEQILGQPVSTATDVYAAGVVLYELLTGRLPYGHGAEGVAQVMHAVVHEEPRAPGVSQDIDTVLLKALDKAPQQRYASIERFAEDLRRVLADEPILARRVPWWQRLRLLVRRHRASSGAAAAAALLLLATAGIAWQQGRETRAQKARGDAVRDFVFTMLADAEPAAGRNEVTGKELLDAATARARAEFAGEPRLRGELLGELGRVYFRLNQPAASVDVLQESLALLSAEAAPRDPALNRTRALLARSVISGDAARAAALTGQALADCPPAERGCADAREHALYALAAISSWRGDHAESLRLARAMAAEAEAAFGANGEHMIQILESLALAARNAGELVEAAAAMERVRQLPGQHRIRAINRNRLDLTQAVLDIDLGRYAAAQAMLTQLLDRDAAPDERATQWRVLSVAELGLGRAAQALHAAEQAQQAVPAGERTAAYWLARRAWGVAASSAGQHAAALQALAQAREGLARAGLAATSELFMQTRRLEAEALLRAGQDEAAATALQRLLAEHREIKPPQAMEVTRTLDALSCSATLAGHADEAQRQLDEAGRHYAKALPPEHPLRTRADALRRLAAADAGAADAVARYRNTLAADSPLRAGRWQNCRDLF